MFIQYLHILPQDFQFPFAIQFRQHREKFIMRVHKRSGITYQIYPPQFCIKIVILFLIREYFLRFRQFIYQSIQFVIPGTPFIICHSPLYPLLAINSLDMIFPFPAPSL